MDIDKDLISTIDVSKFLKGMQQWTITMEDPVPWKKTFHDAANFTGISINIFNI